MEITAKNEVVGIVEVKFICVFVDVNFVEQKNSEVFKSFQNLNFV